MAKLKWIASYETYLYDTPSGDLESGYYCEEPIDKRAYFTRETKTVEEGSHDTKKKEDVDIKNLKECKIIGKAYYSEFEKPDGSILRERITKEQYFNLGKKDSKAPIKEILWR